VATRDVLLRPPALPLEFWQIDQMRDALTTWHMGRVIFAYRTHPHHGRVLSQGLVGNWLELTQAQLSRIENGRPPEELSKLVRYAQILDIPADLLWFSLPDQPPADALPSQRPEQTLALTVIGQTVASGALVGVPGDAGDAIALASGVRATSMDLCSWTQRLEGPRSCGGGAGLAVGTRDPSWGLPADLWGVRQARDEGVGHLRAQRPPSPWLGACPEAEWAELG
jgi:hypothetical protein